MIPVFGLSDVKMRDQFDEKPARMNSGCKKRRIPAHGFRMSSVYGDSGQTVNDYDLKLNAIVRLLAVDRIFSRLQQAKLKEHPFWSKVQIFLPRIPTLICNPRTLVLRYNPGDPRKDKSPS
jgi:hypothetical protein